MNLHSNAATNMEYIQKVFLQTQDYMQQHTDLEDVIAFLDSEPPEFRSVAYEAASMEVALQDLNNGQQLNQWKKFYERSAVAHTFHMDIGLGWAFAKNDISPTSYISSFRPQVITTMVFDGIGYYYALFKGRRTVKAQHVPPDITNGHGDGFDQGVGRRLWYISKGDVVELEKLIEPFDKSRQPELWRGVGIACGYVGGSDEGTVQQLLNASGQCKDQFCTGVALAAISRSASNSITEHLQLACKIIWGKTIEDVLNEQVKLDR